MVFSLHDALKTKVLEWRKSDYSCDFPVISEILNYAFVEEEDDTRNLRYLRKAQVEALETYWYLRLVEKTPHILELYKRLLSNKQVLETFGLKHFVEHLTEDLITEEFVNNIFNKIKSDDQFVRDNRLEAVRESLVLEYPSYILALAMGAGKTVLIATVIATEFAMAHEYPQENRFVRNALVFAPGKTILGALKEISNVPFEKIFPERLYKRFMTNVKFTYTRDGERDIPIARGSNFNIIVTNTEKIRIQKQTITQKLIRDYLGDSSKVDEAKQAVANLRLQSIASLPNLAIFSDEAHHTYGIQLGKRLKRVRQTVDYLAENTNVLVVVNTTGTPYFKKEILRDVVCWYGLSQGIQDGILKEVRGNIAGYEDVTDAFFVEDVVEDFFKHYRHVKIYDGSPAKLAIYFPKINDLNSTRPIIQKKVASLGLDPSIVLEVHNKSPEKVRDLFDNRVNNPNLLYRVFLLVNKGTEGWNCPSLFATALARELRGSNNFCLQAASRCLRQTIGNKHKAKIYLSKANVRILDRQLRETYRETLQELKRTRRNLITDRIVLRKTEVKPLVIKKEIQRILPVSTDLNIRKIKLEKPSISIEEAKRVIYDFKDIPDRKGILIAIKEEKLVIEEDFTDVYSLAVELASLYRMPILPLYEKLKALYPNDEVPQKHIHKIREQIEERICKYKIIPEETKEVLNIIKPTGFKIEKKNGELIYTGEMSYSTATEHLLLKHEDMKAKTKDKSFHYTPYKFDSNPEKDFLKQMLYSIDEEPNDIEEIYFTGGLTDNKKTDFLFFYRGKDGKTHSYSPDFLIRKKDGKTLIVEIKRKTLEDDEIDGRNGLKAKTIREIEKLNPDILEYEMVFPDKEVDFGDIQRIRNML